VKNEGVTLRKKQCSGAAGCCPLLLILIQLLRIWTLQGI
jgi:hypothetical protein